MDGRGDIAVVHVLQVPFMMIAPASKKMTVSQIQQMTVQNACSICHACSVCIAVWPKPAIRPKPAISWAHQGGASSSSDCRQPLTPSAATDRPTDDDDDDDDRLFIERCRHHQHRTIIEG